MSHNPNLHNSNIPDRLSENLKKLALKDLKLGIVLIVLLTAISMYAEWDVVEYFYLYTRAHESWNLDELILIFIWISIVSVVYGIRRMGDIRALNQQIASLAYYDNITDLPNRTLGLNRLDQLLLVAQRNKNMIGVLFLDFDDFKQINDNYGHATGDALIRSVGQRLAGFMRAGDTVARLGGDEFILLLANISSIDEITEVMSRISSSQETPHHLNNHEISVTYSIGAAVYPRDGETAEQLLNVADEAMYQAKKSGKGRCNLFEQSTFTNEPATQANQ